MRRLTAVAVTVVVATVAVLLGSATPAAAAPGMAVAVAEISANRVRLVAAVPGATATSAPQVIVTRDGYVLTSTVRVDQPAVPDELPLRTVVVLLDNGTTMGGSTLRAVQEGILAYAGAVPADVAIGLATASAERAVLLRPTRDRQALRSALEAFRPTGGSALYAGLRSAADLGGGAPDQRVMVVTAGREALGDPGTVGRDLVAARRQVDLVTIGAPTGLGDLRRLVTATGGTDRPAATPEALTGVLRSAAGAHPPLATIDVDVPRELADTAATLMVTTGTGAARTSAEVAVQFAPVPPARADRTPGRTLGIPTPQLGVLAFLVFGSLVVAFLLVVSGVGESTRRRRLRQVEQFGLTGPGVPVRGRTIPDRSGSGMRRTVLGPGPMSADEPTPHPGTAGTVLTERQKMTVRLGGLVVGAVLFGMLAGLLGALFGALFGWLVGAQYPRIRERRRKHAFAEQLPDALQLIVGSLRSGFSLAQAIDAVVQESPPTPLTVELARAMAEVRLGSDLDDALQRIAQRVDNDDLAWAVMAIRIQRETGGNLAEVLETAVETLRERERLRRHVRALSAEGRLSAYVLIGLPFVLTGWLLLARRDYLRPLWSTSLGLTMLIGAALLMAVGIFWMTRWTKVEV